jgi:hypothetical protein
VCVYKYNVGEKILELGIIGFGFRGQNTFFYLNGNYENFSDLVAGSRISGKGRVFLQSIGKPGTEFEGLSGFLPEQIFKKYFIAFSSSGWLFLLPLLKKYP